MTLPASRPLRVDPQLVLTVGFAAIVMFKMTQGRSIAANTSVQVCAILLAIGAGYGLGWFLSPQAKAFRAAVKVALALLATLVCLGNSWLGWTYTTVAAWVGFLMALGIWIGSGLRGLFNHRASTFGSAQWATLPYLQQNGIVGAEGIRLGAFAANDDLHPMHYTGDRHLLTIAPTRSGKGATALIPNLLTYRGSCLVIDPKGENALVTAGQRIAMGQDVHIVDPWNIASGGRASRFNPIDWLIESDLDITENAMLLADALVVPDGSSEKFWQEEAKALLQGIILYVATDHHEAGNRNLARVRDLLLLDGDDLKALWQRMLDSEHHIVASTGARCAQKDDKLFASVIASAQAQTHFLDSARVRESLLASDFKFEDLKSRPMTIYLVLPVDRLEAFSRWLRLLIQQALTVNARNIGVKPKKPVLFILDEMAALGKLSSVAQAYTLMAGFGMTLWGICQNASQLEEIYGKSWEGFIANSGVIQYFGSRDRMTADYFSALCGVTTVANISTAISRAFSHSYSANGGSSSNSNTMTDTSSSMQRQLAYADELMRLRGHEQLVLVENLDPIVGTKVRWFEDEALKSLGCNLHQK